MVVIISNLRIGLLVHGSGIVDTGYARIIYDLLSEYGSVTAKLGGTMGRTAVLDAHLEDVIDISDKLLPSQSIEILSKRTDLIVLINHGKSMITGHSFGYRVYRNISDDIKLLQIERPRADDGKIIKWTESFDEELVSYLSSKLSLEVISSRDAIKLVCQESRIADDGEIVKRRIADVSPDENIMINGVIVGRVVSDELIIVARDGRIVDFIGGVAYDEALDRLQRVDLARAIVKTGLLRKADNVNPRRLAHKRNDTLKVACLDTSRIDMYDYSDYDVIVTIGDDVTLMLSEIFYRFDIPVIGLITGKLDRIVEKSFIHEQSLIIRVDEKDLKKIKLEIKKVFNTKTLQGSLNELSETKDEVLSLLDSMDVEYEIA